MLGGLDSIDHMVCMACGDAVRKRQSILKRGTKHRGTMHCRTQLRSVAAHSFGALLNMYAV